MTSKAAPARAGKGARIVERPDGVKYLAPEYARAFIGLVRASENLVRELDAELERHHGLGLRAFEVLLWLAAFAPDGRMRVSELTERAPLSQSRVSRLVADLENRGLVKRTQADDDGRGTSVSITEAGLEKFKAAQETHLADLDDRLFSRLTPAEIQQLAAITARIHPEPRRSD